MANTSFKDMKRNSKSSIEALSKEASKLVGKTPFEEDNRFWKPTIDKAGNGSATIRFLPASEGEDIPWVKYYTHNFKASTGQWYIENSLTTIGKVDPCGEYNKKLWDTGVESNKKIARDQKRKQVFVSNIYVIADPAHPENNGKVFLYKYGVGVFEKLNEAMHPVAVDGEETPDAVNPFDLFEGCNVKLKVRSKEIDINGRKIKIPNYEKSVLEAPSQLLDDEDEMENIWKSEYPLLPFIAPSAFKSYDQLKARLNKVLGLDDRTSDESESEDDEPVVKKTKAAKEPIVEEEDEPEDTVVDTGDSDDDEDEGMAFFRGLAKKSKG